MTLQSKARDFHQAAAQEEDMTAGFSEFMNRASEEFEKVGLLLYHGLHGAEYILF